MAKRVGDLEILPLLAVALTVLLVLAAGCSGGGDGGDAPAETSTPEPTETEAASATTTATPEKVEHISISGVGKNETVSFPNRVNLSVYGVDNEVRIEDTRIIKLEIREERNSVMIGENCEVSRVMISGSGHLVRIPDELDPEIQDSSINTEVERY